jgi:membrane protease YdiL (CAAX protease family)
MDTVTVENKQHEFITRAILVFFALGLINGFYKEPLFHTSILGFWLQDIVHFVVYPVAILIYFNRRFSLSPSGYGLIKPNAAYPLSELLGACIFSAILLEIIYIAVLQSSLVIFNHFSYEPPDFGYSSVVPNGLLHLPVVIYLAGTAAVFEEVMFRGIPYKLISDNPNIKNKNKFFVLTTSILFAAIHWENGYPDLIAAFVFGLLAAWLYLTYKNLWPLIGAHFLVDIYAFW